MNDPRDSIKVRTLPELILAQLLYQPNSKWYPVSNCSPEKARLAACYARYALPTIGIYPIIHSNGFGSVVTHETRIVVRKERLLRRFLHCPVRAVPFEKPLVSNQLASDIFLSEVERMRAEMISMKVFVASICRCSIRVSSL
jgi:hypothetical protein